jgi:hypothetical protein
MLTLALRANTFGNITFPRGNAASYPTRSSSSTTTVTTISYDDTIKKMKNREIFPGQIAEALAEHEVFNSLKTFMKDGGKSDIVKVYYHRDILCTSNSDFIGSCNYILSEFKGTRTFIPSQDFGLWSYKKYVTIHIFMIGVSILSLGTIAKLIHIVLPH